MIHVDIYTGASFIEQSFFSLEEALQFIRDNYCSNIQNINLYEDTRVSDCYGHS